jgi:hypothetical protein
VWWLQLVLALGKGVGVAGVGAEAGGNAGARD